MYFRNATGTISITLKNIIFFLSYYSTIGRKVSNMQITSIYVIMCEAQKRLGAWDGVVVKALRYYLDGPGIDPRCCHWEFFP